MIERDGRFLLGCRPPEKKHGGLWEFPGGKLDPGEDYEAAMRRELDEELGLELISVTAAPRWSRVDAGFRIHFFDTRIAGEPTALEHTEIRWLTPAEMRSLPLAPTDAEFAALL